MVLISDGLLSAGVQAPKDLRPLVAGLAAQGVRRLDVVAPFPLRDDVLLSELTTTSLPEPGRVVTSFEPGRLAKSLQRRVFRELPATVVGATVQFPDAFRGYQPGDELVLFANLAQPKPLTVQLAGQKTLVNAASSAPEVLLLRSLAQAELWWLSRHAPTRLEQRRIARLAQDNHLLAPDWPLICLESYADYRRQRLTQGLLGPVIAVTEGAFEVQTPKLPRGRAPQVRAGMATVTGRVPPEVIQHTIRLNWGRFRGCYQAGLVADPTLQGRVTVRFMVGRSGEVARVDDAGSTLPNQNVTRCILNAVAQLTFPQPSGVVTVVYPFVLSPEGAPKGESRPPLAESTPPVPPVNGPSRPLLPPEDNLLAYVGPFAAVMKALHEKHVTEARFLANTYQETAPDDLMALLAQGEVAEAEAKTLEAMRAYGSLIDRYLNRAELRRYAAARLSHLDEPRARALATDSLERAATLRPDHALGQRALAYGHLAEGHPLKTLRILSKLLRAPDLGGGLTEVIRQDVSMVARVALRAAPQEERAIMTLLKSVGLPYDTTPSLRFVLTWENDATDVDLRVTDTDSRELLELRKIDVRDGYGPEQTGLTGPERRGPYNIWVTYANQGAMGYALGSVQILDYDGKGQLRVETRPFVIMKPEESVSLGQYQPKV